ncbi:MAG TPA: PAS domain S-box protein, partial [Dehalococcoidia bacterium]|nr:PAS domain S-box protein [Dehalococcoidia bacterium]
PPTGWLARRRPRRRSDVATIVGAGNITAEMFWRLADEAGDAVILADRDGVVRFWNHRAESMFGYASDEALGQSLDLIIPEKYRSRHWEGYHRVMATAQSRYAAGDLLAVPALRKDGSTLSIEFTIAPIKNAGGDIEMVGAIVRDVTERFNRERELRARLAELERAT